MNAEPGLLRLQIRDTLVTRILEGELEPGERLVEMKLAKEFQTSQAPVREALRELEVLGYVTTAFYRGTRVREVPATEMRDALRVRALLEREAARIAASADADWSSMRTALRGIEEKARSGDMKRYVRHDEAFHRDLVTRAGNPVLVRSWDQLLVPTRILVAFRSGAVTMAGTSAQHRWILDALERGEGDVAGERVFEHIEDVARKLEEAMAGKAGAPAVTDPAG